MPTVWPLHLKVLRGRLFVLLPFLRRILVGFGMEWDLIGLVIVFRKKTRQSRAIQEEEGRQRQQPGSDDAKEQDEQQTIDVDKLDSGSNNTSKAVEELDDHNAEELADREAQAQDATTNASAIVVEDDGIDDDGNSIGNSANDSDNDELPAFAI